MNVIASLPSAAEEAKVFCSWFRALPTRAVLLAAAENRRIIMTVMRPTQDHHALLLVILQANQGPETLPDELREALDEMTIQRYAVRVCSGAVDAMLKARVYLGLSPDADELSAWNEIKESAGLLHLSQP